MGRHGQLERLALVLLGPADVLKAEVFGELQAQAGSALAKSFGALQWLPRWLRTSS
jgi:hypothetical protein